MACQPLHRSSGHLVGEFIAGNRVGGSPYHGQFRSRIDVYQLPMHPHGFIHAIGVVTDPPLVVIGRDKRTEFKLLKNVQLR